MAATAETILVVAGEVSGDIHGANLLEELRSLRPGLRALGVGGERLESTGMELVARSEELSHMGLVEVVRELPRIRRLFERLLSVVAARKPRLAVLIDSPDFNLRLAARLGELGVPVVLYVSPQLWAWRRGRTKVVARVAQEVLCILPFEVQFYDRFGVPASFVGHPLVDEISRDGLLACRPQVVERRLALLPGSRTSEVRRLLPAMLGALALLSPEEIAEARLIEAPGVVAAIDQVLARIPPDPRLRRVAGGSRRHQLAACELAWTASGTATLECALLGVPMIVGYRLQPLTYALARLLVRVPHVALANLIAGARVSPELMQRQWNPATLCAVTRDLYGRGLTDQRTALVDVRRRLGGPGASLRAAERVVAHLDHRLACGPRND